jgi:hypothetical protein
MKQLALILLALTLSLGCGGSGGGEGEPDTGGPGADTGDGGVGDTGVPDGGEQDSEADAPDTTPESDVPDTSEPDTDTVDAQDVDAGEVDAGDVDAVEPPDGGDTTDTDTELPDAGDADVGDADTDDGEVTDPDAGDGDTTDALDTDDTDVSDPDVVDPCDKPELCNGQDDDCDGLTDEEWPGLGEPCDGPDSDQCANGILECAAGGLTAVCGDETATDLTELCNDQDDDCDGITDEGFEGLGDTCDGPDDDLCEYGTMVCTLTGDETECSAELATNLVEQCNGMDDDCDGETDELWPQVGQPCDGPDADTCKSGSWTCGPAGVVCVGDSQQFEKCNGLDDDCDGQTDELWPEIGDPCDGPDEDACEYGNLQCGDDEASTVCAGDTGTPTTEVCDGFDNDCDGQTDEGFSGMGDICDGDDPDKCKNGVLACSPDGSAVICSGEPPGGVVELCNGKDDDCDGEIDENWPNLGAPCDGPDSDLCVHGVVVCKADGSNAECGPESPVNIVETCNAKDDDCDGETDEGVVPDDGWDCTLDQCTSVGPMHTPMQELCDDGAACNGVETCDPTSALAEPSGCVAGTPPLAAWLPSSPCIVLGPCDASGNQQTWTPEVAGTPCDDGIACTVGDACDGSGACKGEAVPDCAEAACAAPLDLPGVVNIPMALVEGVVSFGGEPAPALSAAGGDALISLVAKDTGVRHRLRTLEYIYGEYQGGWGYALSELPTYSKRIVPGVYDLVYERNVAADGVTVTATPPEDPLVNGHHVLAADLVLGSGVNTLDIDVQMATVSGTVTFAGAPPPASSPNTTDAAFWLVDTATGARYPLHTLKYEASGTPGQFALTSGASFEQKVVAGTYDVRYVRGMASDGQSVLATEAGDPMWNGDRVLLSGIELSAGTNVVDINVPKATASGTVTFNGAPPPTLNPDGATPSFWLVAKDTGVGHRLLSLTYKFGVYEGKTQYQLQSSPSFSRTLVPGTYDVVYRRDLSGTGWVYETAPDDLLVDGQRIVKANVQIGPGTTTLDIDVPMASITGSITFGGAPPAELTSSGALSFFWLVAKDTGIRHRLHTLSYVFGEFEGVWQYQLGSSAEISGKVVPGTYDVLFERDVSSSGGWVFETEATDALWNGYRIVAEDVVITQGPNTLDIDVPKATVVGQITFGGVPPADLSPIEGSPVFWLVPKDTGVPQRLHTLTYTYKNIGGSWQYDLSAPDSFERVVVPGVYDVLFERNLSDDGTWVPETADIDPLVNAYRVIAADVVIADGDNVLDLDVPMSAVSGGISFDGSPPATQTPVAANPILWLVPTDTGVRHRLQILPYAYSNAGGTVKYLLDADPSFARTVVPGKYAVLYERALSNDGTWVSETPANDPLINGYRYVVPCIEILP